VRTTLDGARAILLIRSDSIGDVVMTTPFLRELRRACPEAHVTLVVAPEALNVAELCPYADRVLAGSLPPANQWWRPLSRRLAVFSFARHHLWTRSYDLAVVPRWGVDYLENSPLAYFSGASRRMGYSEHVSIEKERENRGYDRFFTDVVSGKPVVHEVQRSLDLLSALDADGLDGHLEDRLEIWVSEADELFAESVLAATSPGSTVALGPGAGSPKRMWPIEGYVEVGRWLVSQGFSLAVIGGGGEEEALGEQLRRHINGDVIDLTGKATLRQSAAVLARCALYCGNDSGPMHLAAAAGIPVVEVSCHPRTGSDVHPNSPTRFGPWGVPSRVVQPDEPLEGCKTACDREAAHCITSVPVAQVITAIASLRDERTGSGWSADAS
jgi:heptosyltransferase-2